MSRLIVKNIPKNISDRRLKEIFEKHGDVTQIKIKQKRRFAYVGYLSEKQGKAAVKYLHDTYIDTSKIEVASALAYGDSQIPRSWSKYSTGSSANSKLKAANNPQSAFNKKEQDKKDKKENKKKEESNRIAKEKKLLADIYALKKGDADDSQKQEYWNVMGAKATKRSWANEGVDAATDASTNVKPSSKGVQAKFEQVEGKMYGSKGEAMLRSHVTFGDSDDEYQEYDDDKKEVVEEVDTGPRDDVAVDDSVSDMAYFMSKMSKTESEKDTAMDDVSQDVGAKKSDDKQSTAKLTRKDKKKMKKKEKDATATTSTLKPTTADGKAINTIRMRGLPFTCTENQIRKFFHPLLPLDIRMPTDRFERPSGRAYCDFEPEDVRKALMFNKDHIGDRYIEVSMDDEGKPEDKPIQILPPRKFAETTVDLTALGDSGRLFVRNLAYQCEEDHLKELFEKFGPLSELTIPIDRETKRSKAIAFVSYLMPEHAVLAYQALDGQPFQGRLLHLLPAKEKKDLSGVDPDQEEDSNNYKKRQAAKKKSESTDSFNWNSLFMRQDTVAGAMADAYGVEKGDILDKDSNSSLAVRMALGETHIVAENKLFLEENGVKLDAFGKGYTRSKTLILVKNTPYDTEEYELRTMFSKHGDVGRIIIPPSKTMAIVEMVYLQEARAAFKGLAYRKFKHVPLYLEWAPDECLEPVVEEALDTPADTDADGSTTTNEKKRKGNDGADKKNDDDGDGNDDDDDEGSKGVSPTLFVKNLNFDTTDATLTAFFERCTAIRSARVAKKKNMRGDGHLSMGFGFVEFNSEADAMKALKQLQNSELEGHKVELKFSKKAESNTNNQIARGRVAPKGSSTKLLLKNLGFETNKKELKDLCSAFGQIKSVRLPKKFDGNHRGFAFVDFLTKKEAMSAYEALSTSTHLYGRRIVVEFAKDDSSLEDLQDKTRASFNAKGNVRATKRAKFEEVPYSER